MAGRHHQPPTRLLDLPDGALHSVIKHLALHDRLHASATCSRVHDLVSSRRQRLVVQPDHQDDGQPGALTTATATASAWHNHHQHHQCHAAPHSTVFRTLAAAVAASRPGDTICLAPGVQHEAGNVLIPHPLRLLGGGRSPRDTWLVAPLQSECALRFAASAKLELVAVAARRAPAVVHERGCLTLLRCVIQAEPAGLPHLVSPVLTRAVGCGRRSGGSSKGAGTPAAAAVCDAAAPGGGAAALLGQHQHQQHLRPSRCPAASRQQQQAAGWRLPLVGSGRLLVVECQLVGGSTAVRCGGTGQVSNVRAIEGAVRYMWLEVDSSGGCSRGSSDDAPPEPPGAVPWPAAAPPLPAHPAPGQALLLAERTKVWQQRQRQQQQLLQQPRSCGGLEDARAGVARINRLLDGVNPASLAAHLQQRQQHQRQQQQQ